MIKNNTKFLNLLMVIFFIFNLSILADVTVVGTTKTAYFLDSKVSGLHYQCNNGGVLKTTGIDGNFSYDNMCSEITFTLNNKVTLGKISVANIPADYKVYITNLAGANRTDTTNNYVKNVARVLQSLDSDQNPKNGITLNTTNITDSISINGNTTANTLQGIIQRQYPTRTLVPEICAIVHLEEVLKDDGFYVDTVPPCKPKLALDINATSNDKSYIELIGERNSTIYLNGTNTNLTLDSDGRYYEFELNTTIQRGTFDDFNITFVDATGKISEPLTLHILNDTDQPFITNLPTDNNIMIISPSVSVFTFTTLDDTITHNIPVSYEILGVDKDLFTVNTNGVLSFKSASSTGVYHITIKVIDNAGHHDESDLIITVN
jgi:hypothetical protein